MNKNFNISILFLLITINTAFSQTAEKLPEIVVSSTPLEKTLNESAQPVTVLSGSELKNRGQSSLGAALAYEPGVSASQFGPGASRPVIRGQSGDRIRILENGVGTQDVSNTSPDHATTVEAGNVDKIEVVRGPATLLYGSNAIGGVVNVFDNRIPDERVEQPVAGNIELRGGTADDERTGLTSLNTSAGNLNFHFDAFTRKTNDIKIPGFARTQKLRESGEPLEFPEPRGRLSFSDTESDNLTFGTSYLDEDSLLGASISEYNTNYGVPNGENDISIDAERKRWDLRGKLFEPSDFIKSADLKIGTVDYQHTEFEGSETGTIFKNQGLDARLDIVHQQIGKLSGAFGLQFQNSDFEAIGEEAFQPKTRSDIGSIFAFEEYSLSPELALQGGVRLDYSSLSTDGYKQFGEEEGNRKINNDELTSSQSAGLIYRPDQEYSYGISLSHTERSASGQELFANGPHVATAAYEIGDPELDAEQAYGIDLTARKNLGSLRGSLGGYYNRFADYISLNPSGEEFDGLPVYRFQSESAEFVGIESQLEYYFIDGIAESLSVGIQPDYIFAENTDSNDPLPRIAPFRVRSGINYKNRDLINARLETQYVAAQNRNADFETATPSYTMLNLEVSKEIKLISGKDLDVTAELFLRGNNLTNEKAREHVSFIKDLAPLPGTNIIGGIRFRF